MPLTRRSSETPIRATRSQGSASTKAPPIRSTGQKSATPRVEIKTKVPVTQPDKKSSVDKECSAQRRRRSTKLASEERTTELDDKPEPPGLDSTETGPSQEQGRGKDARKRPAEALEAQSAKKQKPSVEAVAVVKDEAQTPPPDGFSPRRSSRAVVPNRRFKDMELLEPVKKKAATEPRSSGNSKEKEKFAKMKMKKEEKVTDQSSREKSTSRGNRKLQHSRQETVTEEIVTEETPIDAQAQMNLFDEVLVLPQTSVTPLRTSSLQQILPPAARSQSSEPSHTTDSATGRRITPHITSSLQQILPPAAGNQLSSIPPTTESAANSRRITSTLQQILPPAAGNMSPSTPLTIDDTATGEVTSAPVVVVSNTGTVYSSEQSEGQAVTATVAVTIPEHPNQSGIELSDVEDGSAVEDIGIVQASPEKVPSPQIIVVKRPAAPTKDLVTLIDETSHANLIPKFDDNKKKLAEQLLKQTSPTKPTVIALSLAQMKKSSAKIRVTPTHTAKNEAYHKKAKAAAEKMHQGTVTVIGSPDKSVQSSFITDEPQSSFTKSEVTGYHTTEADSTDLEPLTLTKSEASSEGQGPGFDESYVATSIGDIGTLENVNESKYKSHLDDTDKIETEAGNSVANLKGLNETENSETTAGNIVTKTEVQQKVNIVYVKAKPGAMSPGMAKTVVYVKPKAAWQRPLLPKPGQPLQVKTEPVPSYEFVNSPIRIAQLEKFEEIVNNTDNKEEPTEGNIDNDSDSIAHSDGNILISDELNTCESISYVKEETECVGENSSAVVSENLTVASGTEMKAEENTGAVVCENLASVPGNEIDTKVNVPDDTGEVKDENVGMMLDDCGGELGELGQAEPEESEKAEEKVMSSFCQVIPMEPSQVQETRETQQTAIEYVMFGDKMVPIHKPMPQVHGRVTTVRQPPRKRPGRVETGGQAVCGTGMTVKKIPVNAAQTAINSVLAQIGGDKDESTVILTDIVDSLPETEAEEQLTEATNEEGPTETPTRVIHGYIDRPVSETVEPTQIVEISQDLFAKEVYGEGVVLDTVSDDIVSESMVSIATSVSMAVDATSSVVSMTTADSTDDNQMVSSTDVVETIKESRDDANDPEEAVETVSSLPLEDSSQAVVHSMQVENQGTDSDPNTVNQQVQAIEIVNVSAEALLQCTEELSESSTPVEQAEPPAIELHPSAIQHTNTFDPKVTTHYNEDGSMVIRIEGAGPAPEHRVSMVTVPNIIRVKTKPSETVQQQKGPKYITIQSLKDANQSNKSNKVGYKKLVDVKINPAVGVRTGRDSTQESSDEEELSVTDQQVQTVSTSTNTETQTETDTQTETSFSDEEENLEEEDEEGIPVQEVHDGSEVVVVTKEKSQVKRTTKMTVREDGQLQEYVVVSLPEGAEVKNTQARQSVRDPVHDEIITMGEDGMYVCIDCDHKTDKKSNWYKHRRKHLGIRPHACSRCSYKAATSSNLKRHMQIHDDVRNFVCSICSLMFRQKIHLERHIKYKHQEKKVKCPLCEYLCSSENPDLKIHIRRRHMPHEGGSMGAFTCQECGLMTVSKKDLKQHMKFHKKGPELKLFCEFCSFVTDCESRLRRHMLIHTKEKPFQCGLCSYRASQKEHVLRHMRSQHDIEVERKPRRSLLGNAVEQKEKPRRSLLDGVSLLEDVSSSSYEKKEFDEGLEDVDKPFEKSDYSSTDKIFACNHCSMKFSKLINLYKHLYVQHKQVMPDPESSDFQCVVCEFRTNNKKNLLVHMRKHNMNDHNPPSHVYSCVLCRYINPKRRNLFQHMKKKHGIEIVMKEDGSNCYVTSDNTSVVFGNQPGEPNVMALSEIVTTETIDEDSPLQIVTEDGGTFQSEKISIDNMISVDDMAAYVSGTHDQHSPQATVVSTSLYQTVAEHEAAEAIEGLQALAQQPGVVETQTIENDITTEIVTSEILAGEEVLTEDESLIEQGEDAGIQLSSEQINQLSSGDYVEINGEVYKVEIAQDSVV